MKTRTLNLIILVALVVLLSSTLNAQMAIRQPLFRVDIPFAFMVGSTHLPAGYYYVYHPGDPYLIVIERDDGRARAMAYVHPADTNSDDSSTKLVFNKYGEQYFLAQVWNERDQQVHHCFKCPMERELLAKTAKSEVVVVAAKR